MKRVLVVEDEREIAEAIRVILADEGYEVAICADGSEALGCLQGGLRPDLVLTDVMMPRVGGLELLDRLAANGLGALPVVLMSAVPLPRLDGVRSVAFLRKPFSLEDLVDVVERHAGRTSVAEA